MHQRLANRITQLCLVAFFTSLGCAPHEDTVAEAHSQLLPDGGVEPLGLRSRPVNRTCVGFARPTAPVRFRRVFERVALEAPLALLQAPGDDSRFYAVQQGGQVRSFSSAPGTAASRVFIDLSSRLGSAVNEAGLLGMAFAPDWPTSRAVYLSYVAPPCGEESVLCSRISRFRSVDGGASLALDSEEVLLTLPQPAMNHNGGNLAFGPDGFLYIGFGDGGPGNDPNRRGQDRSSWLGKMLRIDVRVGSGYRIPAGNPFAAGGGRPEIWALGFRNPWRWSFDRQTGALWLGDVGQREREEINVVVAGGNYGWRRWEGTRCTQLPGDPPCSREGFIFPIAEYGHAEGQAVTGGYVYRGRAVPSMVGKYVYGDFVSGRVWAVEAEGQGPRTPQVLQPGGFNIASFGEDNAGELYLVDVRGDALYRMEAASEGPAVVAPQKISETGCFVDGKRTAGTIPFDVNSPLWSDGASKSRFLAIPDGTRITIRPDGDWDFPLRSVLIKTFRVNGRQLETRLLVRHDDGDWAGYAYVWDGTGTDATLAPDGADLPLGGGGTWHVPSSAECLSCHTAAAGRALGLETAQLNRDRLYPATGITANQLATLEAIGMFSSPLSARPWQLPALPEPLVVGVGAQARARSYLHANCSHCHRPGGPGLGGMDLRYSTGFPRQGLCDVVPAGGGFGLPDARLFAPGSPERSLIAHRPGSLGDARMPPLGTAVVDADGVELIRTWIRNTRTCPSSP